MWWGILGGATAVALEILYRKGLTWTWPSILIVAPMAVAVSYSIMKVIQSPSPYIVSLAWFTACVSLIRLPIGVLVLHDPIGPRVVIAAIAMLVAVATRLWR